MKTFRIILALCLFGLGAIAQDINPGLTFTDGQRLTASELQQLVSLAQIQPTFYTRQVAQGAPANGDVFVVYSASSGTFHKLTAQALLYANTNIISSQVAYTNAAGYCSVLFYDPTNVWLGQIPISSLGASAAQYVTVSNLVYWTTNGPTLAPFPTTLNMALTNNQQCVTVFATNGIPYYVTLSNLQAAAASFDYTNFYAPLTWKQMFAPWTMYGTNLIFPYTNAWGVTTNFPITSTNFNGNTNLTTLSTNDSFPLQSSLQNTNTSVTIGALLQYIQGLNALPAYTSARVSFNGNDAEFLLTNTVGSGNELYLQASVAFPFNTNTPTPFNFFALANGTFPSTTPAIVATNQIYYGIQAYDATNRFLAFTNYQDGLNYIAHSATNAMTIQLAGTGTNQVAVVTNYSSQNSDVVPIGIGQGVYDVWFRSLASSTNYYVSGSCLNELGSGNSPDSLSIAYNAGSALITTNRVRVEVRRGSAVGQSSRVYILISPQ
jgi:hypothetical protein